jgi:ATP-dependent DNA helicase RecG
VENQKIEWKRQWRDEFLKGLCGLANVQGGTLEIGRGDDGVVIGNNGTLPERWTVADLLSKHRSRPHNPKIANTFFRSGFIETWGRGIERITTACREAGRREPLFEVSPGEVKVTFYIDDEGGVNRSGKEAIGGVNGADLGINGADLGINGADLGINGADLGINGADLGINGADLGANVAVNDFRKAILELMLATPTISTQRIADIIDTTKRRIGSNINAMKKAGIVERVGTNKTGHWVVRINSKAI